MNSLLKYLKICLFILSLSFFLLKSLSHSFSPYVFEIGLPANLNVRLNEEVRSTILVRNKGSIGDSYEINITPSTSDIYVSLTHTKFTLEPQNSKSLPISLTIYSILGNKSIRIRVCSLNLVSFYGERVQTCTSESCTLGEGFSCITSIININTATYSLGKNLVKESIIIPLFLIIFVILLSFHEYKHLRP